MNPSKGKKEKKTRWKITSNLTWGEWTGGKDSPATEIKQSSEKACELLPW